MPPRSMKTPNGAIERTVPVAAPAFFGVGAGGLEDAPRLELLLHGPPLPLEAGAAERQDHVPFLGLGLEDIDEDGVADVELRRGFGVAAVELPIGDDAFA